MADDVIVDNGTLTDYTVATDDIGSGRHAQLFKVLVGTDGTATFAGWLPTNAALADGTANPTTPIVGAADHVFNGTTWDRTPGNTLDGLQVNQKYTIWADSLADGIDARWTQSTANGGTITSTSGEGRFLTSTATNGSAQVVGPTIAYRPGAYAWMNSAVRFGDTGTAGDIRRIGMFTVSGTTPQEGAYFELSGTTLNAVYVKGGSATATAAGSWSVATFAMDTNYHSYQIRYTANTIQFIIDNALRHVVTGTSAALTTSLTLPITITNVKTSGATDIGLYVRNIGAGAFGDPGYFQVEDFPSGDGDRGIGALAIRKATPANTSGTDGDYEFLQMSAGRLWVSTNVDQINGVAPTMGNGVAGTGVQRVTIASDSTGNIATIGTSVVPGTGATNLGKAEDAGHTTGDTGVMFLAVRRSDANALTALATTDDDYIPPTTDTRGVLQVVARPNAARISTTSASLTTATTAYAIGDQAGGQFTITNAAKVSGGTGVIQSIVLMDEGDVGTSYRLHFYQASVTPASDNAAFAVSDADQRNYIGHVLMPDMDDVGANRVTTLTNVGMGYTCSGSTSLFCLIETRTANAVYAAATDLKLIVHLLQD